MLVSGRVCRLPLMLLKFCTLYKPKFIHKLLYHYHFHMMAYSDAMWCLVYWKICNYDWLWPYCHLFCVCTSLEKIWPLWFWPPQKKLSGKFFPRKIPYSSIRRAMKRMWLLACYNGWCYQYIPTVSNCYRIMMTEFTGIPFGQQKAPCTV